MSENKEDDDLDMSLPGVKPQEVLTRRRDTGHER